MSDWSDDAKALFEAARPGHEPTQHDREQVRAALWVRIGGASAVLGVAQTGTAATLGSAATGGKLVLAVKLVVALAVTGGAGTVAYRSLAPDGTASKAARGARTQGSAATGAARAALPAPTSQASAGLGQEPAAALPVARPVLVEPKTVREPPLAGVEPSAPLVSPLPVRRSPSAGGTSGVGSFPVEPARSSELSLEARALSQVQRAVREGRSGEALALLDQQEREFPRGELRQERVAARVVALCANGKRSEARALAATFLARSPRSPLAARMRAICLEP
jgi:hypothetical protein